MRTCPCCGVEWTPKARHEKRRATCGARACVCRHSAQRRREEYERRHGVRECAVCGAKLRPRQQRTCSNECKHAWRRRVEADRISQETVPTCICGEPCKRRGGGYLKTCGRKECRYRQTSRSHVTKRPTARCRHCGRTFRFRGKEGHRQFCSRGCYRSYMSDITRTHRACAICGRMHFVDSRKRDGRKVYCSKACAGQARRKRLVLACSTCAAEFERTPGQMSKTTLPYCPFVCFLEGQRQGQSVHIKHGESRVTKQACLWCGSAFSSSSRQPKFCSHSCSAKFHNAAMDNGFNRDTSIEIALQNELLQRGYDFRSNPKLHGIGVPDIVLDVGGLLIAIEADGDYWHDPVLRPQQAKRDQAKTKALQAAGYQVFRFWEREIRASAAACIDRVEAFIVSREG